MPERTIHRYEAFGLKIASEFPLEELRACSGDAPPDLTILDRDIGIDLPAKEQGIMFDYTNPDGAVFAWPGVAAFRFVDENTIWARLYNDAPDGIFAFPFLGPVMAWFLNMRGLFVLHSSAVHLEGRTLAFLGDKLAGKSTTAAAFVRSSASLVTDDLLAIRLSSNTAPICLPAFPQLKLEDVAAATIKVEGATARPLIVDGFPKRQHSLPSMMTKAVPMTCLVRLERGGDRPAFTRMDGPEAVEILNRYSYLPRFSGAPWTKQDHANHFSNCMTLAQQAIVGTLQIPADLDTLGETVEMMRTTLSEMTS
ncbi:MAG: hypothetical protein AAGK01_05235 [Pseudomonadota bacterium]